MSSFFCRKKRHVLTYTPTYTVHPLRCTLSPSFALTFYPHTRAHKKNCQHLHSGKWCLNSGKTLGWIVTWSVTCYWTVSSLIGACHKSSNCWFVYKLKLTVAKCLLSPLHACTQPEPATRAQDQSMDQPSTLNISPIPVWHITITMKQYANCCSWISQPYQIQSLAIVEPIIQFDMLRDISIKPDNLTLVSCCNKSWCYLTK